MFRLGNLAFCAPSAGWCYEATGAFQKIIIFPQQEKLEIVHKRLLSCLNLAVTESTLTYCVYHTRFECQQNQPTIILYFLLICPTLKHDAPAPYKHSGVQKEVENLVFKAIENYYKFWGFGPYFEKMSQNSEFPTDGVVPANMDYYLANGNQPVLCLAHCYRLTLSGYDPEHTWWGKKFPMIVQHVVARFFLDTHQTPPKSYYADLYTEKVSERRAVFSLYFFSPHLSAAALEVFRNYIKTNIKLALITAEVPFVNFFLQTVYSTSVFTANHRASAAEGASGTSRGF